MAPIDFHYHFDNVAKTDGFAVRFPIQPLLEWDNWPAAARALIEESSDGLDGFPVFSTYVAHMVELHDWVLAQFDPLWRTAIDEVNELIRQRNLHLTGGPSAASSF